MPAPRAEHASCAPAQPATAASALGLSSTARSSFDRDVQRQLRKASPVPPPPAKVLSGNRMTIDYPLNFTLTR